MAETKNIGIIMQLLKKESKSWKHPFVSEWGRIVRDPFTTLISCLLSLRTKDETTARASIKLLKKYNTPEKILKLSAKKIEKLIYPVGFYRTKAKRIKEICRVLIKEYKSKVPDTFDELIKLKGVGPKTASIVVVYGYNKPDRIPVDTHVHQISNRLGWVNAKTPEKTQIELEKIIPKKYWYDLNELFVQFGQNICVPVSPFCSKCLISRYCPRIGVKRSR
ncbi:endonuclease III [Candidatus Woesearchaeota archaeon]|nr:endonuclease III [Candidatus Woesearchaeota archaeon]